MTPILTEFLLAPYRHTETDNREIIKEFASQIMGSHQIPICLRFRLADKFRKSTRLCATTDRSFSMPGWEYMGTIADKNIFIWLALRKPTLRWRGGIPYDVMITDRDRLTL